MGTTDEEKDYEAFKSLVDLWKRENLIKTCKLQALLIVNGLLVSAVQIAGGFRRENWFVFLTGFVLSFIWLLSLGRTILFQKVWQIKAHRIASKKEYADDIRFAILNTIDERKEVPFYLRALGGVSSKYYLLGAPLAFSAGWIMALCYTLLVK